MLMARADEDAVDAMIVMETCSLMLNGPGLRNRQKRLSRVLKRFEPGPGSISSSALPKMNAKICRNC